MLSNLHEGTTGRWPASFSFLGPDFFPFRNLCRNCCYLASSTGVSQHRTQGANFALHLPTFEKTVLTHTQTGVGGVTLPLLRSGCGLSKTDSGYWERRDGEPRGRSPPKQSFIDGDKHRQSSLWNPFFKCRNYTTSKNRHVIPSVLTAFETFWLKLKTKTGKCIRRGKPS